MLFAETEIKSFCENSVKNKEVFVYWSVISLVPGRPSRGGTNEVDRLKRHQAEAALTCDEENSSSSNDSISASRSRISDDPASRDTANDKSRLQRPEHRQVPAVLVLQNSIGRAAQRSSRIHRMDHCTTDHFYRAAAMHPRSCDEHLSVRLSNA